MSAEVTYEYSGSRRYATVAGANHFETTEDGYLVLRSSSYGTKLAIFTNWLHVVITPDRDRNGRFVKRGY